MKEYLKMADVFIEPLSVREKSPRLLDCCGALAANFLNEPGAKYAAHAINSHDELVAEVERLRESNKRMADAIWSRSSAFDCLVGRQEMTRELFIEQFLCDPLKQPDAE